MTGRRASVQGSSTTIRHSPEHDEVISDSRDLRLSQSPTIHSDQKDQDEHTLTTPGIPEPRDTRPGNSNATSSTMPLGHEEPGHHPELSITTTATGLAISGHDNFSDREEVSSKSSVGEGQPNENAYPHVSGASGHPYQDDARLSSGDVSAGADVQDAVVNHLRELRIKEDGNNLTHLHEGVPGAADAQQEAVGHDTRDLGEDVAVENDIDENSPHFVVLPTPQANTGPSDSPLQGPKEYGEADEESEKTNASAQRPEGLISSVQNPDPYDTASEMRSGREHNEPAETESDIPGTSEPQQNGHRDTETVAPKPLQDKTVSPSRRGSLSELDKHTETSAPEGLAVDESVLFEEHRGYGSFSETTDESRRKFKSPEQGRDSFNEAYDAAGHNPSEDDDTDTDSQQFVSPLPSHYSLRGFNQQQASLPHSIVTDDYVGGQHYSRDNAEQYEIDQQNTATVYGEDDLFDDTDPSEDHAFSEDIVLDNVGTSQPETPVWQPSPGQIRTQHVDSESEEGTPEVTTEDPSLLENRIGARGRAEEADSYVEDDGQPELRPKTPPLHMSEIAEAAEIRHDSPKESPLGSRSSLGSGLAASRHNPERPQTPTGHVSLASSAYVTPETAAAREFTNFPWRADDGWTPQSHRTQSTHPSSPPSPLHIASTVKHETMISSDLRAESPIFHGQQYSSSHRSERGAPGDGAEGETPVSLMAPWQGRESPVPSLGREQPSNRFSTSSEGNAGSLFQRMRNIFEQQRTSPGSNRDSYPGSVASRPSSGTWLPHQAEPHSPTATATTTATQKRFSSGPSPAITSEYHHGDTEQSPLLPRDN